jgi:hypothetical protein
LFGTPVLMLAFAIFSVIVWIYILWSLRLDIAFAILVGFIFDIFLLPLDHIGYFYIKHLDPIELQQLFLDYHEPL